MIKRTAKQILPPATHNFAAGLWRAGAQFRWDRRTAWAYRRAEKLICFGVAPGDDLLCTAVLRELASRGHSQLWMMSNYPELFQGNADVARVVPLVHRFEDFARVLGEKWALLNYTSFDAAADRNTPPPRHIIAEMCSAIGLKGPVALRPYFHLTAAERAKGNWAQGQIAIQSSGLGATLPMRNKQWFPERFQGVVDSLKAKHKFVQLGVASDPLLNGVRDLRGKTSLRETAAILANARLLIGNVGFLMHLARAVECAAVIVYGGREAPWQSGYTCNRNLYSAVPCAPCWQWNRCDYNRVCMDNISVAAVVHAVEEMMARGGAALEVASINL
jgi:hypothetical protein